MTNEANKQILDKMTITPNITLTVTMGEDAEQATKVFTLPNDAMTTENAKGGSPSALLPGGSSKKSTRRNRSNRKRKQATKSRRAKRNRSLRNK